MQLISIFINSINVVVTIGNIMVLDSLLVLFVAYDFAFIAHITY